MSLKLLPIIAAAHGTFENPLDDLMRERATNVMEQSETIEAADLVKCLLLPDYMGGVVFGYAILQFDDGAWDVRLKDVPYPCDVDAFPSENVTLVSKSPDWTAKSIHEYHLACNDGVLTSDELADLRQCICLRGDTDVVRAWQAMTPIRITSCGGYCYTVEFDQYPSIPENGGKATG